nr:MAG TPA: hypothetical protein [Caudoviricetes sp.]
MHKKSQDLCLDIISYNISLPLIQVHSVHQYNKSPFTGYIWTYSLYIILF